MSAVANIFWITDLLTPSPLRKSLPGALLSVITRKQGENGLGGLFSSDTSRV